MEEGRKDTIRLGFSEEHTKRKKKESEKTMRERINDTRVRK